MMMLLWIAVGVLLVVGAVRMANHSYTRGSGLFKNSEHNLEKEKHLDVSDYQYYNDKDKLQ